MSEYQYLKNQGDFVPHGENKGMNPFERFKDNSDFIRILRINGTRFTNEQGCLRNF
jgi:hypothetical protein